MGSGFVDVSLPFSFSPRLGKWTYDIPRCRMAVHEATTGPHGKRPCGPSGYDVVAKGTRDQRPCYLLPCNMSHMQVRSVSEFHLVAAAPSES